MKPRAEVLWFAGRMERKLLVNDHKGGWNQEDPLYLLKRCQEELDELSREVLNSQSPTGWPKGSIAVVNEAADLANLAMMLADLHRPATVEANALSGYW